MISIRYLILGFYLLFAQFCFSINSGGQTGTGLPPLDGTDSIRAPQKSELHELMLRKKLESPPQSTLQPFRNVTDLLKTSQGDFQLSQMRNPNKSLNWKLTTADGELLETEIISWGTIESNQNPQNKKFIVTNKSNGFTFQLNESSNTKPTAQEFLSPLFYKEFKHPGKLIQVIEGYYQNLQEVYILRTQNKWIVLDVQTGNVLESLTIQKIHSKGSQFSRIPQFTRLNYQFQTAPEVAVVQDELGRIFIYNRISSALLSEPLILIHNINNLNLREYDAPLVASLPKNVVSLTDASILRDSNLGRDFIQTETADRKNIPLYSTKINDYAAILYRSKEEETLLLWGRTQTQYLSVKGATPYFHLVQNEDSFTLNLVENTSRHHCVFDSPVEYPGEFVYAFSIGSPHSNINYFMIRTKTKIFSVNRLYGSIIDELPIQAEVTDLNQLQFSETEMYGSLTAAFQDGTGAVFIVNKILQLDITKPIYFIYKMVDPLP